MIERTALPERNHATFSTSQLLEQDQFMRKTSDFFLIPTNSQIQNAHPSKVGSPIGLGGALCQSVDALEGICHSHQGVHCGSHLVRLAPTLTWTRVKIRVESRITENHCDLCR